MGFFSSRGRGDGDGGGCIIFLFFFLQSAFDVCAASSKTIDRKMQLCSVSTGVYLQCLTLQCIKYSFGLFVEMGGDVGKEGVGEGREYTREKTKQTKKNMREEKSKRLGV